MDLSTPLSLAGPAFRMKKKLLAKLGLLTIEDMLFYLPYRYEDSSLVSKINILQVGETATIKGQVVSVANIYTRRGMSMQKVVVADDTGKIECVFFNQKFILRTLHERDCVSIAGRVQKFGSKSSLLVKSYELLKDENAQSIHTGRLVPIYSQTPGLSAKWIRGRIMQLFDRGFEASEYLPEQIVSSNRLMPLATSIKTIHFPNSLKDAEDARIRLSFDELFLKHAAAMVRKKEWESKERGNPFEIKDKRSKINDLIKNLPFELTPAQKKAIEDIISDVQKDIPMNRLLEGDVGSGKTIVASIASYIAYLNGFQTAFMAPTEILANQHFATVSKLLSPLGVRVELFTGSSKRQPPTTNSQFNIAVGTHALLHGKVQFQNLGLTIIDEQQRFGVSQRAVLKEKGVSPHLLSMTATPIPRTIFLTIYADLALSVLDELPKGRKKIKTWLVPEAKRENSYKWISDKIINEKSQIFIVCPFIEPSETLTTIKAVKEEFERLKKIFPNARLGLLHGKMKSSEKDEIVSKFRAGSVDILVATPVIEVGIDIPTADIMLIEAAERFGLAQLHQLRGRVGRGEKESYCLLFTGSNTEKTKERLGYMQTIDNGMELAEVDLKLRGPGDMFGTAQHGMPDLKVASLSDYPTVEKARKAAEKVYPDLAKYPKLREKVLATDIPKISKD